MENIKLGGSMYSTTLKKVGRTSIANYYATKEGIIYSEMLHERKIEYHHLVEIHELLQKFVKQNPSNSKVLIISDFSKIKGMSRGARTYKKLNEVIGANALIATDNLTRMVANFLVGFNKNTYPIKIFKNYEDALQWIKQFQ